MSFKQRTRDVATLILFGIGTLIAGSLATQLEVSPDNRIYYSPDNERYQQLLSVERTFDLYSNVTFLISANAQISETSSAAIQWLSRRVEGLKGYVRHSSLDNYPHLQATGDDVNVSTTLEVACPIGQGCADLTNNIEFNYLKDVERRLISRDQSAFSVSVAIDIEIGDSEALTELILGIRTIDTDFDSKFPNLDLDHTGAIPMMQAFADASNDDLGRLFPIAIGLMFVLSVLLYGSAKHALFGLACALFNVVIVMGVASLFELTLNSATSVLPIALLVISVSAASHLVCYVSARHSAQTMSQHAYRKLVNQACMANRTPILIASFTTCVGLATLVLVDIPPFREFGVLAATGAATNYLIVMHALPAAMRLASPPRNINTGKILGSYLNAYARYIDQGKLPIRTSLVIFLVATLGLSKFSLDENYIEYFDQSHEFRVGADALSANLSSPYSIDVAIDFPNSGDVLNPENLGNISTFEQKIRNLPKVTNVSSITLDMDRAKAIFGSASLAAEDQGDYTEQMFLAYELSLPVGHSTSVLIDQEKKSTRLSVLLEKLSSREFIHIEEQIISSWGEIASGFPPGTKIRVTGESLPLAHLASNSIRDVLTGVFVCLILVFSFIFIRTRSTVLATVGVFAVVAPLALTFGAWAWVAEGFGLATALIIAVTIGIIVDDTTHFMHRYNSGRSRHRLNAKSSVGYAVHHSGPGIIASSAILVAGFSVLAFSTFAINEQFGVGVSLSIASALLLTLVALPATLLMTRTLN